MKRLRPPFSVFRNLPAALLAALLLCTALSPLVCAVTGEKTGAEAWLRYSALSPQAAQRYQRLPAATVRLGDSLVLGTASRSWCWVWPECWGELCEPAKESPTSEPSCWER